MKRIIKGCLLHLNHWVAHGPAHMWEMFINNQLFEAWKNIDFSWIGGDGYIDPDVAAQIKEQTETEMRLNNPNHFYQEVIEEYKRRLKHETCESVRQHYHRKIIQVMERQRGYD